MGSDYKQMIHTIKTALSVINNEDKIYVSSDEDFDFIFQCLNTHDLAHYMAPLVSKLPFSSELCKKIERKKLNAIFKFEHQEYELQYISELFQNEGINHVPLKGAVLWDYYDEPWMRLSGDVDILVREEDLEKIKRLLVDEGQYSVKIVTENVMCLTTPVGAGFEFHTYFLEDSKLVEAYRAYSKPVSEGSCRYAVTNEVFILHHISHMKKHFLGGGCGIKSFIDLWVIINKMEYDEKTLEKLLSEFGLARFYDNAIKLTKHWFGDGESDDTLKAMEDYVFHGGVYGTHKQKIRVLQTKRGGAFNNILSKVFLSYKDMCIYYPSLEKCPILFPFYQVRRWGRIFFFGGRKAAIEEIKANQEVSRDERAEMKKLLKALGL